MAYRATPERVHKGSSNLVNERASPPKARAYRYEALGDPPGGPPGPLRSACSFRGFLKRTPERVHERFFEPRERASALRVSFRGGPLP